MLLKGREKIFIHFFLSFTLYPTLPTFRRILEADVLSSGNQRRALSWHQSEEPTTCRVYNYATTGLENSSCAWIIVYSVDISRTCVLFNDILMTAFTIFDISCARYCTSWFDISSLIWQRNAISTAFLINT